MKHIIMFIVCVSVFTGCRPGKQTDKTEREVEYKITYNDPTVTVPALDLFREISYLPLETNDSSLLSNTPRQIIRENGYLYITDINTKKEVYIYDLKGKYVRKISRRGEGPEEYIGFFRIAVNKRGWVTLGDRVQHAIVTYDTEGNFISKIRIDTIWAFANLAYLNDSILLMESDQPKYKFHVLNMHSRKVVNTFDPMKRKRLVYGLMYDHFTTYDGKCLLAAYQNNNAILEVNQDSSCVRYRFNINDKMPPADLWTQKDADTEELKNGYIGHIPCFAENDRSMFLLFCGNSRDASTTGMAFIDKATDEVRSFRRIALTDKIVIEPENFYSCGDGKIIFALSSEFILDSGDEEFIARFPGLERDSNPILMFAELK